MSFHPSRTQQMVINDAMRAPSFRRAPLRAKLALFEALGTEANYTNPAHGDRDSLGALQQRASWGSAASRLNVTDSAERFLQHAIPLSGKYGNSGDLAQAVQRSAFPSRYIQHKGEAQQILGQSGGGQLAGGGSTTTSQTVQLPQLGQVDIASLLSAVNQPRPVQVSAPPQPAFAAKGPPTPFGYTPPPQVGTAQPQGPSQIDQLLQMVSQPQIVSPGSATTSQTVQNPGLGGVGPQIANGLGRVRVASGADRAGVGIKPITVKAVERVAGVFGHPLTIGTGTNHNRMTVNGNVSDHWDGHAADIPASGGTLTKLGQSALEAFGVPAGRARKTHGGLFNIQWQGHRVQVIFNTNEGGNHFTHLHVGIR